MGVPIGARAGGEPHDAGDQTRRLGSLLDRVDIDVAGERAVGAFAVGLGAISSIFNSLEGGFWLSAPLFGARTSVRCCGGSVLAPAAVESAGGVSVAAHEASRLSSKRVGGGGRVARASRARVIAASGERHCAERSNPLHGFGIDCSVEEIGRDFRPFGTPPRGLLVGVQFRQCGDHVRPAVEEVAEHP